MQKKHPFKYLNSLLCLGILTSGCRTSIETHTMTAVANDAPVVRTQIDAVEQSQEDNKEMLFLNFKQHAQTLEGYTYQSDLKRQEVLSEQISALSDTTTSHEEAQEKYLDRIEQIMIDEENEFYITLEDIITSSREYAQEYPNTPLGKKFTHILKDHDQRVTDHLKNASEGTAPFTYLKGKHGVTLSNGVQVPLITVSNLFRAFPNDEAERTKSLAYQFKKRLVSIEETKNYYYNLGRCLELNEYGKNPSTSSLQDTIMFVTVYGAQEEKLVKKAQEKIDYIFYPEKFPPALPFKAPQKTR